MKSNERIVNVFSEDAGNIANDEALHLAIINPEHGYYVRKRENKYELIEIKEAKKFQL